MIYMLWNMKTNKIFFPIMTPSPSQISSANIVQNVQYRFEYYPRKSQKINSHIIQNVFHTLRIILKQ